MRDVEAVAGVLVAMVSEEPPRPAALGERALPVAPLLPPNHAAQHAAAINAAAEAAADDGEPAGELVTSRSSSAPPIIRRPAHRGRAGRVTADPVARLDELRARVSRDLELTVIPIEDDESLTGLVSAAVLLCDSAPAEDGEQ